MSLTDTDEYYMAEALRLAEKGMYSTQPNPRVGCVLVKNDRIIGRGFCQKSGEAHAEIHALNDAGPEAKGSTAYVTLEPCSFKGKTGACTEALIKAGVSKVVCATKDPHPKVNGKGLEILQQANIEVAHPLMESSAKALNPGSIKRHEQGLPFVRCKMAMSLDGKIALANGKSKWITSAAARQDVQRLRAQSSAIVTGVQTVIDDDPLLNVRADELNLWATGEVTPETIASILRPRVVLDSTGRLPANAKILEGDTWIATTTADYPLEGVTTLVLPANDNNQVDLNSLLKELAHRECNEVLFECGPTLAGSLIAQQLLDELIVYMSGRILGDKARSLFELTEIANIDNAPQFRIVDVRYLEEDLRLTLRI